MLEELTVGLVQPQGIWAVLFVFLLPYTIKKDDRLDELQETHGRKYRELLTQLTVKLSIINTVNEKLDTVQAALKEESDQRIKAAFLAIFQSNHIVLLNFGSQITSFLLSII